MRRNKPYVIGITGGIGSGKSLVLNYLASKYSCLLIKADDYGNIVKLKGNECYQGIVSLLGKEILDNEGEIIKNEMAKLVFADDEVRKKVNDIIHPAVRNRIENDINNCQNDIAVIEAALLCEADYFPVLNELWEVRSAKDIRIKRLMESRSYTKEKCLNIINSQNDSAFIEESDREYRKSTSRNDYYGLRIIENNGSVDQLKLLVDNAMEEINERI